jgi:hypothetical protein
MHYRTEDGNTFLHYLSKRASLRNPDIGDPASFRYLLEHCWDCMYMEGDVMLTLKRGAATPQEYLTKNMDGGLFEMFLTSGFIK